jgi:hypothetical protein
MAHGVFTSLMLAGLKQLAPIQMNTPWRCGMRECLCGGKEITPARCSRANVLNNSRTEMVEKSSEMGVLPSVLFFPVIQGNSFRENNCILPSDNNTIY